MTGPYFDHTERAQLCDLLEELGPDAPTLVASWTTCDLAAHLLLRERDWLAAPGLVVPGAWHRFAERRSRALAGTDFLQVVSRLRSGPPPGVFRISWFRRGPNLNEFFVHHEDVRRANGRGPRTLSPALDEALWANVVMGGRFLTRRLRGAGLELHWAGTAHTVRVRRGEPAARISGTPGELLIDLFGRPDAVGISIDGPPAAVQAVHMARFGM